MDLVEYTYNLVRQIPPGKVSTYGAVAEALGDKIAARAVGRMMNQNPDPDTMPCYKIVHSDGRIGGFGLGVEEKIRRLREDNIEVVDGKIKDFEKVLFKDFKTTYPLQKLREKQLSLKKEVSLQDKFREIHTVAGFDVAYPKSDFDECCAAIVIMDYHSKEIIERRTIFDKTRFPYIPTYLAFRELPFLEKLLKEVEVQPTILMVDGNGILHPFEFGLACHVGVTLGVPCIGVAKTLLCGSIRDDGWVVYNDKILGYAFYTSSRVRKPVYISPGHNVSLPTAVNIVKHVSTTLYKNPIPLREAHILATSSLR
ncbi:MAG TPA: methylated-DNA--[protein]-cysteine S-methyltransferase [Thermoplasmatales archaeon]|nr:methylated-DNA--[protein]-cysteine S-methyltransferase [Thermoplasmatales archaeon]